MSEWFGDAPGNPELSRHPGGDPIRELPRPDDAQRERLRRLAKEWQPMTQDESDALSAAVKEFASKHNISLEEE